MNQKFLHVHVIPHQNITFCMLELLFLKKKCLLFGDKLMKNMLVQGK